MNKIPLLLLGTILFTNIITSQQWLYISASMVSTQHTAHSTQHTAHRTGQRSTADRTAQCSALAQSSTARAHCSVEQPAAGTERRLRGACTALTALLSATSSPIASIDLVVDVPSLWCVCMYVRACVCVCAAVWWLPLLLCQVPREAEREEPAGASHAETVVKYNTRKRDSIELMVSAAIWHP
jgi:hypothetical protein